MISENFPPETFCYVQRLRYQESSERVTFFYIQGTLRLVPVPTVAVLDLLFAKFKKL